jgi:hypothetical protein
VKRDENRASDPGLTSSRTIDARVPYLNLAQWSFGASAGLGLGARVGPWSASPVADGDAVHMDTDEDSFLFFSHFFERFSQICSWRKYFKK